MPNNQNMINNLLNLMNNRVYRRQHKNVLHSSKGTRVIGEKIDNTGIGSQNETDNIVLDNSYIFDCGHANDGNLGGECHYCDSIICKECISICSSCGHSICPQHTKLADFDGTTKPYCTVCADEIPRKIRLNKMKHLALSFFIDTKGEGE